MKINDLKPSKNFEDRRGVNPEDQDKLGELIKETTISIPNRGKKGDLDKNMPEAPADGQLLRGIGKADRAKVKSYKVR